MQKIRLLLADDHNILRQGLIDILERYDDFCIVAEAEDGYNMINKYFAFNPDVVLCDIEMPGLNGIEAAQEIIKNELVTSIRAVANGEKYFMGKSIQEVEKIKVRFDNLNENLDETNSLNLTALEKQILFLVAEGKTSQEMSELLHKSKRTIDAQRASIISKLNLETLPRLIKYAVQFSFTKKNKEK